MDIAPNPPASMLYFDFTFGCLSTASCPSSPPDSVSLDAQLVDGAGDAISGVPLQTFTFAQFDGQLGWRTKSFSIPTSVLPGTVLTLRFTAKNLVDTNRAVLIDNIRFETVFLDVKILEGSGVTEADVRRYVRNANEIIPQGGFNARIRQVLTITALDNPCVGASPTFNDLLMLDTNSVSVPLRTSEMKQLLCQARTSPTGATDVHVYIVQSLTTSKLVGLAVTPDDYNVTVGGVRIPRSEQGIILANLNTEPDNVRETLAHELGHLLISGASFISTASLLEHNADMTNLVKERSDLARACVDPNNLPCPSRTILNSTQSKIFQVDVPAGPSCPVTCPH
jgi:hypothetical protein